MWADPVRAAAPCGVWERGTVGGITQQTGETPAPRVGDRVELNRFRALVVEEE
jgi:hypothetical protein